MTEDAVGDLGASRPAGDVDRGGAPDGDRASVLAVYASGRLVDAGAPVGAVGFDPEDAGRPLGDGRVVSGWSVFTGEETEGELTDAERVRLPSLSWVVSHDPAVAMLTAGHDGSAGYWVRGEDDRNGLPSWQRLVP